MLNGVVGRKDELGVWWVWLELGFWWIFFEGGEDFVIEDIGNG